MADIQEQLSPQSTADVKLDYLRQDIREIKSDVKDIKADFVSRREFTEGLNDIRSQLEPMRKDINDTNKLASDTLINYKTDKARIWVAIAVLLALGGTIITLSIMAIDTKIKVGIDQALSGYDIQVINKQ